MKLIIPIILPQHAVDLPQSFSTEIILEILTRKKKKKKNELRNWFTTNKYTKQERSNYYDITYQFFLLPFTTPTKYISHLHIIPNTERARFDSNRHRDSSGIWISRGIHLSAKREKKGGAQNGWLFPSSYKCGNGVNIRSEREMTFEREKEENSSHLFSKHLVKNERC